MIRPWITEEFWEQFLRRQASKGKWSFVWRVGILGWGVAMVCATSFWFYHLTRYSHLTIIVVNLLVWLPAGAIVGLGLWSSSRKTDDERREFWLQQKKRGKVSFVLRHGVLRFGIPMFFIFTALCIITLRSLPSLIIVSNLLILLSGGAIVGLRVWTRLERKYQGTSA